MNPDIYSTSGNCFNGCRCRNKSGCNNEKRPRTEPRRCEIAALEQYQRVFYPLLHNRSIPHPLLGLQHSLCRFDLLTTFADAPEFLQIRQVCGQRGSGDTHMRDKALAELVKDGFVLLTHTAENVPLYSGADRPDAFRKALAVTLLKARHQQAEADVLLEQHGIDSD